MRTGPLLVDSADPDEIAAVNHLITGVTVNPALLKAVTDKPLDQLAQILKLDVAEVYYQPTGAYGEDLTAEAQHAVALAPERVIVKVMATPAGAVMAARLREEGARIALTGAQTSEVMVVATAIGCHAVIPYVDRGMRDPHVSATLVGDLAAVRQGAAAPLIVAASVKSGRQVVHALQQGADAVSAATSVLAGLLAHHSVIQAEQDFAEQYRTP